MNHSFPTVNLSSSEDETVKAIGSALSNFGFLAVDGHPITSRLLKRTYDYAENIFNLPLLEKTSYSKPTLTGMPRGFAVFSPQTLPDRFLPDYKEAWHFGTLPQDDQQTLLNETNLWHPSQPIGKEIISLLYSQMNETAMLVLDACSLYIGKPREYFRNFAKGDSLFRMLKYPAVPAQYDGPLVRTAAHEDLGMLTIMCAPTTDGLEFLTKERQWMKPHDLQGKLIINVGEILADMTDDFFHSPIHRVTGPDTKQQQRYSLVAFIMARYDAPMGHLHQSRDIHNLSVKEYLTKKIPQLPQY